MAIMMIPCGESPVGKRDSNQPRQSIKGKTGRRKPPPNHRRAFYLFAARTGKFIPQIIYPDCDEKGALIHCMISSSTRLDASGGNFERVARATHPKQIVDRGPNFGGRRRWRRLTRPHLLWLDLLLLSGRGCRMTVCLLGLLAGRSLGGRARHHFGSSWR